MTITYAADGSRHTVSVIFVQGQRRETAELLGVKPGFAPRNVQLDVDPRYNQGRLTLRKPEERQINGGSIRLRVIVETEPGSGASVVFDKEPAALWHRGFTTRTVGPDLERHLSAARIHPDRAVAAPFGTARGPTRKKAKAARQARRHLVTQHGNQLTRAYPLCPNGQHHALTADACGTSNARFRSRRCEIRCRYRGGRRCARTEREDQEQGGSQAHERMIRPMSLKRCRFVTEANRLGQAASTLQRAQRSVHLDDGIRRSRFLGAQLTSPVPRTGGVPSKLDAWSRRIKPKRVGCPRLALTSEECRKAVVPSFPVRPTEDRRATEACRHDHTTGLGVA
jgi:hypothetical protein